MDYLKIENLSAVVEAPIYTDPRVLGLTEEQFQALIWVRDQLASGDLKHSQIRSLDGKLNFDGPRAFNMDYARTRSMNCGTVCCIGGWMAERLCVENGEIFSNKKCRCLFYPGHELIYRSITAEQAVRAIDNFTIHSPGDPQWERVINGV
jgi:hypothetical protein